MPRAVEADIAVSGGGIAGLAAAAALGSLGYSVCLIDPAGAAPKKPGAGDTRTTALLQPSRSLFEEIGAWRALARGAAELKSLRIIERGGRGAASPESRTFESSDISDMPFAWNIPNSGILAALRRRLEAVSGARVLPGVSTARVVSRSGGVLIRLSDGTRVSCRLLVAADGRDSPVRRMLGIDALTVRYGQRAMAASVSHERPHEGVSIEIHESGGPFTLVPLPARKGGHRSAAIWMDSADRVRRLANMEKAELERRMTERSGNALGRLSLSGGASVWPVISRMALRLAEGRVALVSEAAHVTPPIGAQGLNMGIADVSCLYGLLRDKPGDPGGDRVMRSYARIRGPDVAARIASVDLLNRASMAKGGFFGALRGAGLRMSHDIRPLRLALMHAGLGPSLFAKAQAASQI